MYNSHMHTYADMHGQAYARACTHAYLCLSGNLRRLGLISVPFRSQWNTVRSSANTRLHCTQIYTRADTFESTYLHAPMCTSIYTYAHTPPQDNMFEPLEHLEDAKNKTEVCICAKCWTTSLTYTLANTTANPLSECVISWCAYVQKVLSFAKNKLLEYLSDPKVRPSTTTIHFHTLSATGTHKSWYPNTDDST